MSAALENVKRIINKVHKSLECSICLEILEEPHSTQCNHQFCRNCVEQLFTRKKGKSLIVCPLCKTKISKRGLSQSRKLVDVVAAVKNVLSSVNEDLALKGTPITKDGKPDTKQIEVSEETPFQGTRNLVLTEKDNTQSLTTNLNGSCVGEDSFQNKKQNANTRKSRKLRWSDEAETGDASTENLELLKTLETSDLGRKQKNSKYLPRHQDRQLRKTKNVEFQDDPVLNRSGIKDYNCNDINGDKTRVKPIKGALNAVEHESNDVGKASSKFIVPETPLVQVHEDTAEEQFTENSDKTSAKPVGRKKVSPFSNVNMRAPLKLLNPNGFDFVDDYPLDASDLCERVKQRRKRVDTKSDEKQKKTMKTGPQFDIQSDLNIEHNKEPAGASKLQKGAKKKVAGNAKKQPKLVKRKGKTQELVEGAWGADQEINSQVIDSCSTINPTENERCADMEENVNMDVANSRNNELSCDSAMDIKVNPTTSQPLALPQDKMEVSIIYERDLEDLRASSLTDGNDDVKKDVVALSGCEVIPTSAPSPDASLLCCINPMESPLYKSILPESRSNQHEIPVESTKVGIERLEIPNYDHSECIKVQDDAGRAPKDSGKMSMNLYSESGSKEMIAKENSCDVTIESAPVQVHVVDVDHQRMVESIAVGNEGIAPRLAIECNDRQTSPCRCSQNNNVEDIVVDIEKTVALDREIVKINVNENLAGNVAESNPECINWETDEGIRKKKVEMNIVTHEKDIVEDENDSTDSTPSLCKDELFSQDTFYDEEEEMELPRGSGRSYQETAEVSAKHLENDSEEHKSCSQFNVHSESYESSSQVGDKTKLESLKQSESSTQRSHTQASISILVSDAEDVINRNSKHARFTSEDIDSNTTCISPIKPDPAAQVTMDFHKTGVSVDCQTGFLEPGFMTTKDVFVQTAAEMRPGMTTISCQTETSDSECLDKNQGREHILISAACQTSTTGLESYFNECNHKESNVKETCNDESWCTQCKRDIHKFSTDIYEMIRKNIQVAVAQQKSSIFDNSMNYPLNFTASGAVVKESNDMLHETNSSSVEADVGIRIERLKFIPVWMMPEKKTAGDESDMAGVTARSTRSKGTSKRNLVKRLIDESKKKARKLKHRRESTVLREGRSKAKLGETSESENRGEVPWNVVCESSLDQGLDIINTIARENRMDENSRENKIKSLETDVNDVDSTDGIIPATPLSDLPTADKNVKRDKSYNAKEKQGKLNCTSSNDLSIVDSPEKQDSTISGPENASRLQETLEKSMKLNTKAISSKRKARQQVERDSSKELASKRVKLSRVSVGAMADSLTPSIEIRPQIVEDNHRGEPLEIETILSTKESAVGGTNVAMVGNAEENETEPSFAVLARKEDDIMNNDEAIVLIETPSCIETQNKDSNDDDEVDEDDHEESRIKTASNCSGANTREQIYTAKMLEEGPENSKTAVPALSHHKYHSKYAEEDEQDLFASDGENEFLQNEKDIDNDPENETYDAKESMNTFTNQFHSAEEEVGKGKEAGKEALESQHNFIDDNQDSYEDKQLEPNRNHNKEHDIDTSVDVGINAEKENHEAELCMHSSNSRNEEGVRESIRESYISGMLATHRSEPLENGEASGANGRIVPNFMTLVKEYAEGKGDYRTEDDSDEEQSFLEPYIKVKEEENINQACNSKLLDANDTGELQDKQDLQDDPSPSSPTPPPRIKRKRTSPPEVQAALTEIKQLIHCEEGEDFLGNDPKRPRHPELYLSEPMKDHDSKLLSSKICSSKDGVEVKAVRNGSQEKGNPAEGDRKLFKRGSVTTEGTHGSPNDRLETGPERKTPITPQYERLQDGGTVSAAFSNERRTHRRSFITTPKIKTEKPLTDQKMQTVGNDLRISKSNKHPKILVPSRLNKKQMVACKYLASKTNCQFSTSYLPGTSHLIMGTDENLAIDRTAYTYKYLMALITGSSIVSFQWVLACLNAETAVDESMFEVRGDPSSNQEMVPNLARLSKLRKESPIFHDLTLSLIGDFKASNMTKEQLVELLQRGGAKVLSDLPRTIPSTNFLLIVDSEHIDSTLKRQFISSNIQPVHYEWITESIINFKVQDPMDFLLKL